MSEQQKTVVSPAKPAPGWSCPQCGGFGHLNDGSISGEATELVIVRSTRCGLCRGKGRVNVVPIEAPAPPAPAVVPEAPKLLLCRHERCGRELEAIHGVDGAVAVKGYECTFVWQADGGRSPCGLIFCSMECAVPHIVAPGGHTSAALVVRRVHVHDTGSRTR